MKLSFDKFERYELPQITLCNPNSRATEVDGKITITDTVGVLSNPKGMNLKLNFNAPHELSFDYYQHKSTDPIKQSFYDSIYESIQTDRYIYLTDIGYFVISSVTDSDEDNIDKKSISLKSCEENELATAEGLHLKEGTYYLHNENNDGLLDLFLPKTAGWTIGFIDPSLLTKPYYVEDTEVDNGYNFLYTTVQDMFECIVEPDIIKRTISVYSRVYYAEHHLTDIHIAKYNLLKHKTVEENDEDKYTALNVQGKDENLEIRTVNPTGKNVIYNFEPRYSWMSPALQEAVEKWQKKCESVEEEYLTLQQGYYNDMQNIVFPLEQDIQVLELQLKQQQQTRDLIVIGEQDEAIKVVEVLPETGKSNILYFVPTTANNYKEYVWENDSWKYIDLIQVDDISDTTQQKALDLVNSAINSTNIVLSEKRSTLDDEKNKIQINYSERIDKINSECALETTDIFTTELRNELMTHIKPTDYVDEYMLVTESMTYTQRFEKAKELMDRAQLQLVKISSGQKTYSIDTRSFLFNKQFKHFSEQLYPGAIIYTETKNDIMEQLHLTGIDINFDEKSAGLILGNKYDRSDLKALYDEALGQNSKSFSELKYIAGILEDQQKQLDYQRNWVADLRTLTLDNVLTSEDQAIEINNRGLIGRKRKLDKNGEWDFDENGNPFFESEQVKLINNTLVFTEDNWNTASTAVGKIAVGYNSDGSVKYAYGINGQVLIGELILGNNLVLTGTGAGLKITNKSGENAFYADDDGNLILSGTIFAQSGSIGDWNIKDGKLYSNEAEKNSDGTVKEYKGVGFSPWADGQYCIWAGETNGALGFVGTDAKFLVEGNGKMHASAGTIGGWNIDPEKLWARIAGYGTGMSVTDWYGNPAFWAGYIGSGNTPWDAKYYGEEWLNLTNFYVTNSGYLFSKSGNIGGFYISNDGIYRPAIKNNEQVSAYGVGMSSNGGNYAFWAGETNSGGGSAGTNAVFKVGHNGNLVATNATITGTIKASNIEADCFLQNGVKVGTSGYSSFGDWKTLTTSGSAWQFGGIGSGHPYITMTDRFVSFSGGGQGAEATLYYGSNAQLNGTWNTQSAITINSDAKLKNTINTLSDKYTDFFDGLSPVTYKYNDGTSGRLHVGFIAQEVQEALEIAKIDTQDFAGLVIYNKDTEDEKWTLRYEEFIALNTWQIQKAKSRITELENTVAELKTQIQILTAG